MTWIVGKAGPFGHAIGISDIRVTIPGNGEFDCLQKIYRIAGNMALGFAGSVQIGLEVVAQITTALNIEEENKLRNPFYIADFFKIGTKQIFNKYSQKIPNPDTHFLLFSAHPTRNDGAVPWAKCFVHRFRSPEFEPEIASQSVIVSIGSGSNIEQYRKALEKLSEDTEIYQQEVGVPGGYGLGLMMSLTDTLNKIPKPGISQYLQTVIVGRESVRISNNFVAINNSSKIEKGCPKLAQSWEELEVILHRNGISSIQGITC